MENKRQYHHIKSLDFFKIWENGMKWKQYMICGYCGNENDVPFKKGRRRF